MNICFSTAPGYSRARSNFLGSLACILLVFGSTTAVSFAGFENGVHRSEGRVTGPVQPNGFNVHHDSVVANNPYLNGYPGEAMEHPGYRGPLVSPNRETIRSRNGFVSSRTNQIGAIRLQEEGPRTRDLNPASAARPFGDPGQRPQRNSAQIDAQKSEFGAQHLSPNPADSRGHASIDEKFQRYENKFASDPRMSDERRERLNRARVFFGSLIDLGYAPLTVDSWCDDLLDDRVDDGMPMDLVDSYWGQPVSTQEFVEYYAPYELCTYRIGDSDYRQVTYKNGVVSEPAPDEQAPNEADVPTE
jgi:hypothetical protein